MVNKRAFIIHGWDGYPDEGWFPWLKTELEKSGFQVHVPVMPEPAEPKIEAWVQHLSKIVGDVDENTFFVGHSIGCQTILRYLESLPTDKKVGGVTFVAGWFTLMNLKTEKEKEIAKPWLETPIDFDKVKQHTKKFFAVFSDDDEVVPPENKKLFEEQLGAKTALEHDKGHFSGSDGVKEIPVVLKNILNLQLMTAIRKKVWREYFEKIISGKKKLELRLGDFEINEGDTLVLEEWDKDKKEYTGRKVEVVATYILKTKGQTFWSPEEVEKYGFQIIQFEPKEK